MPRQTPQKETPNIPQGRDLFQTPNYAIDLLIPYIPENIDVLIWEPACGDGKISRRLEHHGYRVFSTDIRETSQTNKILNFLDSNMDFEKNFGTAIITNPPFSLTKRFYKKCLSYGLPFALLINANYKQWVIDAVVKDGCEKLVPYARINYITPTGLTSEDGHTADFHSMWLTKGFGLGKTETFVELSVDERKNNI